MNTFYISSSRKWRLMSSTMVASALCILLMFAAFYLTSIQLVVTAENTTLPVFHELMPTEPLYRDKKLTKAQLKSWSTEKHEETKNKKWETTMVTMSTTMIQSQLSTIIIFQCNHYQFEEEERHIMYLIGDDQCNYYLVK